MRAMRKKKKAADPRATVILLRYLWIISYDRDQVEWANTHLPEPE